MVRQMTNTRNLSWKALLAISVASGGLIWHIIACTESPMSFSPDGKHLAFVTMEPYDDKHFLSAGSVCYRLMVLSESQRLRVLEKTTEFMLTAPAYSPDGQRLCYLRIPLLTKAGENRLREYLAKRKKALQVKEPFRWRDVPASMPSIPSTTQSSVRQPSDVASLAMPPLEFGMSASERALMGVTVPGMLVIRDVDSHLVVSTVPLRLQLGKDPLNLLFIGYHTIRPQYSSDGKWVYLCAANDVISINLATGELRHHAIGSQSTLSPRGDVVAVNLGHAVGLVRTDGRAAAYRRLEEDISLSGMMWINKNKLAVLTFHGNSDSEPKLYFLGDDGNILGSKALRLPKKGSDQENGELAIAHDGRHMVIGYGEDVFFLNSDGKVLKHWEGKGRRKLAQPTFTPDSKQVAFKYVVKEDAPYSRVVSIVFFTPNGKETSRVVVPGVDPSIIHPTSTPSEPAD